MLQNSTDKISTKLEILHLIMISKSQAIASDIMVLKDEIALQTKRQQLDFVYCNPSTGKFDYKNVYGCNSTQYLIPQTILKLLWWLWLLHF